MTRNSRCSPHCHRAGDGWVSVNPLRQADLRGAVEVLAATARVAR
ncbi:hypothetical protein [Saccharopolyspora erythraea]|nr:hypothetical protein [Saccharopolyspora erythraea]